MILTTALLCLASNIFFEARGEPDAGQRAIAAVTMNRAKRDPKKVCATVLAKGQFSWTAKHVSYNAHGVPLVRDMKKYLYSTEEAAWRKSLALASSVLEGAVRDNTRGATHFHADHIAPRWSWNGDFIKTAQIGRHSFYRASKSTVTII